MKLKEVVELQIRKFYIKHPQATRAQCVRATGFSRPTVDKYTKIIETENAK